MRKAYRPVVVEAPLRSTLLRPFLEYARSEANSGLLLMGCAAVALILANSPWSAQYFAFWNTDLSIGFGETAIRKTLLHWINDGLMTVFFLLVGLEIKRELLIGDLSTFRKASLPILAALGGMVVPALIFLSLNPSGPTTRGWGIPMATDIAFALGVLGLLGRRVPAALKVFLAAVAIVDDIGAVLVIAVFYTGQISMTMLGGAAVVMLLLLVANHMAVRAPVVYVVLGFALWAFFMGSGIHATIAGVLLAFTIPTRVHLDPEGFARTAREAIDEFDKAGPAGQRALMNEERQTAIRALERACERVQMPLERIENVLQPWVSFGIVPIFALANAGVSLMGAGSQLGDPLPLGIVLGLVVGKPLGIALFSYIGVRAGIATLPHRVGWLQLVAVGVLGGIGFTMSLFITDLAFGAGPTAESAKLGIIAASAIAGLIGYGLLRAFGLRPSRPKPA